MNATANEQFSRCIARSKRVRWDIETDVICGRRFDLANKFLPDGLTLADRLDFLSPEEKRYFSQVQGRTYANMFGLVERFIGAKVLELTRDHWLGDQVALEALVRFGDEELKHQVLFRRIEALIGEVMPPGYTFAWDPNEVAAAVLRKSSWAVLGLDPAHRAVHPGALSREHPPGSRSCPSWPRTSFCSIGGKSRSTRSWTSSNGAASTTPSPRRSATGRSMSCANWSKRWMRSCRPRPPRTPATSPRPAAAS